MIQAFVKEPGHPGRTMWFTTLPRVGESIALYDAMGGFNVLGICRHVIHIASHPQGVNADSVVIEFSPILPNPPQDVDPLTPLHVQARTKVQEQLDFVGPKGSKMGHVTVRRELAEALLERMVPDDLMHS